MISISLYLTLTDIMIETSTLLAESTDSSCAKHKQTNLINLFWMYSINIFLFRSRTQPPLFLLHRSPLVSSSAWGLVLLAQVQARSPHQIFRQISIVDLPRILLVFFTIVSHSSEFSGTTPVISFPLIIIFKLFTKHLQNRLHQEWIAHIQQRGLPPISLPSFLCTFFKVALQSYFDFPTVFQSTVVFHMYSHDAVRLLENSEGMFVNFILLDSFHDECLLGCSCSQ